MITIRRRLIVWLIRAYIKKWGRSIFIFFILGLVGFFLFRFVMRMLPSTLPIMDKETVGMVGSFTINSLPSDVLDQISQGLTKVSQDGTIKPGLSTSWKIDKMGKIYTFNLRKDVFFSDGTKFTSKTINYGFSDVKVIRPDDFTIIFQLKDSYAPFLVTVSRPIFKKGFVGIGNYQVKDVELNGSFVTSIDLYSTNNERKILRFQFFPTEDALKTAFVLGEVSRIYTVHDINFRDISFSKFKTTQINKLLYDQKLATLFINVNDKVLSEKKIRNALFYTIPDKFDEGLRNSSPFSPLAWANTAGDLHQQDLAHAKELISSSSFSSSSAKTKFTIKTLPQYEKTAKILLENFKRIGIAGETEVVESIPLNFQMFLGDFWLSKDPDQYMLWHSNQKDNITGYKNLRIDKLLEDGRKTVDFNERRKIYSDFIKYMHDDPPAFFLYVPFAYEIKR
ncbi:MAG: hypothetical protein HYT08_00565 [Candidatus Levybacteria bacterium]|nr:hypothetical protein [Candidatus Levybacteria bacterium]